MDFPLKQTFYDTFTHKTVFEIEITLALKKNKKTPTTESQVEKKLCSHVYILFFLSTQKSNNTNDDK